MRAAEAHTAGAIAHRSRGTAPPPSHANCDGYVVAVQAMPASIARDHAQLRTSAAHADCDGGVIAASPATGAAGSSSSDGTSLNMYWS